MCAMCVRAGLDAQGPERVGSLPCWLFWGLHRCVQPRHARLAPECLTQPLFCCVLLSHAVVTLSRSGSAAAQSTGMSEGVEMWRSILSWALQEVVLQWWPAPS